MRLYGNKYQNKKTEVNGIAFDSLKEARRFKELKLIEKAGEIYDLQLQVKFELIPTQREPDIIGKRGGVKKGKVIEREVNYYADFTYKITGTNELVVEDTKGMRTKEYILKRKMMLYFHNIRIREV